MGEGSSKCEFPWFYTFCFFLNCSPIVLRGHLVEPITWSSLRVQLDPLEFPECRFVTQPIYKALLLPPTFSLRQYFLHISVVVLEIHLDKLQIQNLENVKGRFIHKIIDKDLRRKLRFLTKSYTIGKFSGFAKLCSKFQMKNLRWCKITMGRITLISLTYFFSINCFV